VVEIRDEAAFHDLRSAWEALQGSMTGDSIFQTWEWASAWWSAYGTPGELRIAAVVDGSGITRGIAPLRAATVRGWGQRLPALSFVGDGSNDSDYLDVLIAPGHEASVSAALRNYLADQLDAGTVLQLNEVPAGSPNLALVKALAAKPGMICQGTDAPCGSIPLPQSWADYLAALRPRFRSKIRSTLRNLEERSEARFGICHSEEQARLLLAALFDLHGRRWAAAGQPGVFRWPQKRDFYFALTPLLLERGWLRFTWLEWDGRILACQYGFSYKGTYSQLQEGYEPAAEHYNPGTALRAWSIRHFIEDEGLREYDFLGGMGRHKEDWGAQQKQSRRILLARNTLRHLLFCRGPEWQASARERIGRLLPERLIAARQAFLQGRGASEGRQDTGATGRSWLRSGAARSYAGARLPQLLRPMRERYRVSFSRNSGVSWERRTEACGRILYYHRVNDESDPFFPACPTRTFEEQIRFVARHYRIVSLCELLRRLEQRDPATDLVAVTFDDGYRDNYRCALPILRRYGVPATIFLTTGSIDDRRPLWFERLAHAIANTAQPSVDLEIDIPRRFWLRNQPERLAANGAIFGLLRQLSEEQRRGWEEEIIRRLGWSRSEDRNDHMLTWEEARAMLCEGIAFGAHTVTHPFLSRLTPERAAWEVTESKRRIETELQSPVEHFAYPNGREQDFTDANKTLLRDAGYRAAFTTIWGPNYRSTDPMELRRGQPWETDAALFAWKFDWYQFTDE
jgi:CelD/BcsL family acetyltransferase involved in cellulose biosynthesis/peptidoglycan/xylan/chitin deacetylase (PgdA/CDA1 family)